MNGIVSYEGSLPFRAEAFLDHPERLRQVLTASGTFNFRPYASGLFPASDLPPGTARATGMGKAWFRDNVHVANALFEAGELDLASATGRAMFTVFKRNRDVLCEPAYDHRLVVRIDGDTLQNDTEHRVQNDSVGYPLWFMSKLLDRGALRPTRERLDLITQTVGYLAKIRYWQDVDQGHWEERDRIHASSIGVVVAGLRHARQMLSRLDYPHRLPFDDLETAGMEAFRSILAKRVTDLPPGGKLPAEATALSCSDDMHEPAATREYLRSFSVERREHDAALLFLVEPLGLLQGDEAEAIVQNVRRHLARHIGTIRYPGDTYWEPRFPSIMSVEERTQQAEGATERRDQTAAGIAYAGAEAQWTIFDSPSSTYSGKKRSAGGGSQDRADQLHYLNRSLAQLVSIDGGKKLLPPEAFYLEYDSGVEPASPTTGDTLGHLVGHNRWTPNHHMPLLWAQANLLTSLLLFEKTS